MLTRNAPPPAPHPLRILLVEDEMMVAMLVEDILVDIGHTVVGPLAHLDKAMAAARDEVLDLAILDVNINGGEIYPVAEVLAARGIPFAFATGYGVLGLREDWQGRPTLQKPFRREDLCRVVHELVPTDPPG
jgi:two-component SAPR family response regulator